jgi:long-subunit fatty acid transport protein
MDIKSIGNNWKDENYEYTYSGLGTGVSAFHPINAQWTLVGSIGFMPQLRINDNNGDKIGDGNGSALDIGFLYHVEEKTNLSVGLKSQSNTLNFDTGSNNSTKQEHQRGGLYLGIAHQFYQTAG